MNNSNSSSVYEDTNLLKQKYQKNNGKNFHPISVKKTYKKESLFFA